MQSRLVAEEVRRRGRAPPGSPLMVITLLCDRTPLGRRRRTSHAMMDAGTLFRFRCSWLCLWSPGAAADAAGMLDSNAVLTSRCGLVTRSAR